MLTDLGGKPPQMRSLLAQLFLLDQNASKWRLMLALNYLFKFFCSLGISRVSFRVSTVSQNVLRIAKIPKIYIFELPFIIICIGQLITFCIVIGHCVLYNATIYRLLCLHFYFHPWIGTSIPYCSSIINGSAVQPGKWPLLFLLGAPCYWNSGTACIQGICILSIVCGTYCKNSVHSNHRHILWTGAPNTW